MRKYLAVLTAAALVVFAAPAVAATNPFMDVPLNHWAYDAIGQLAAQGVLSGYPDGTYKGKQPTTRYEMASALARALAVVDMTKAGRQDVEMLKRLVIEFKDELDALGVKVDQLDARVGVLESRLGGWNISGWLALDIDDWRDKWDGGMRGNVHREYARLTLQRWFGEDDSIYFRADLRHETAGGGSANFVTNATTGATGSYNAVNFRRFFVEFPVFGDAKMTVGHFEWNMESPYYFFVGGIFDWGQCVYLTDSQKDSIGITKNFGLGSVKFYAARSDVGLSAYAGNDDFAPWEFTGVANLQFTEQFGVDLGFQAFWGDKSTEPFNSFWTYFGGVRFNFNENIALKGIYYGQSGSVDNVDRDDGSAFKVILDVKQDLLGFTSLWLEYNKINEGFFTPNGLEATLFFDDGGCGTMKTWTGGYLDTVVAPNDLSIWRIGATQQWNEKWRTFAYFGHHTISDYVCAVKGRVDVSGNQWGIGVQYQYNANVTFGLSYIRMNWDKSLSGWDNYRLQFKTDIWF